MAKKATKKRKLPHETSGLRRALFILSFIGAALLFLVGAFFLSRFGPKKVDYRTLETKVDIPAEVLALQSESIELEAQFEEILVLREPTPDDIALLQRSLELQKEYLTQLPSYDADGDIRRDNLEKRYQNVAAAPIHQKSLDAEEEAQALAREEAYEAARAKYREALDFQKEVNEDYPLSSVANPGRATRLQRQARYLTAEPLFQRGIEFEREADVLIEERNWDEAEAKLREAIAIQDQLNREYRGTNQASVARLEGLKIKIVGIRSGQSNLEIEKIADLADVRRLEGENLEAASLYEEAARLQRELNREYRDSPHASSERVDEFLRKAQTASSVQLGLEIDSNHTILKALLSERRTYEAAEVIVDLRRDIRQMAEQYPRSSLNNEELEVKVRYLNLVQNDIGFIQDRLYESLLPIPNVDGWRMLRTEVPQALYSLIMGTNPSRNIGDVNPVDSVSWTEAKEFCERLSWIMGKEVRLPTENEFRESLGRLRYVVLEEHVWSVSNTEGVAQSVGGLAPFASGYFDLLGNVSEWLESIDRFDDEDARHIGGHVQDRLEVIFTVPVRESSRGGRSRLVGFRIVMNDA